jgi:predicted phage-related endonuclease
MKDFFIDYDLKIGSSFDYFFGDDGILEIKNVDSYIFNQQWLEGEAPLHIEFQVQHQLLVADRNRMIIGVLVGGNEIKTIERERDEQVIEAIKMKCAEFWARTSAPQPDFEKDAEFIKSLYKYADPNKIIKSNDRIEALALKYKQGGEIEKQGKALKDAAKAEILTIIRDAEKVKGDNFSISAGLIGPSEYVVKKDGYRNFKITWKKEK